MLRKFIHARGYPVFVNGDAVRFVAPHRGGQHSFLIFDQFQKVLVQGAVDDVAQYVSIGGFMPPTAKAGGSFDQDEA